MSKLEAGRLKRSSNKKGESTWTIIFTSKKGKEVEQALSARFVSTELQQSLKDGEEAEVEFERHSGVPRNVREKGKPFSEPATAAATTSGQPQRRDYHGRPKKNFGQRQNASLPQRGPDRFHNPYNFVPAPKPVDCVGLERGRPAGHHAWFDDRFSGQLKVEFEAVTPLLLLDTHNQRRDENGHLEFDIFTDNTGKAILRPTGLKGPLRAAYEAVTNSRMAVFSHPEPLARRMDAGEGLAMIPARVVSANDGKEVEIELYMGSHTPRTGSDWRLKAPKRNRKGRWQPPHPLYAAWLERYPAALPYKTGGTPEHGKEVSCLVVEMQHYREIRPRNQPIQYRDDFRYWKVVEIVPRSEEGKLSDPATWRPDFPDTNKHKWLGDEPRLVHGWVCVSNQNIVRKHAERVFFTPDGVNPVRASLPENTKRRWKRLIADYWEQNERLFNKRGKDDAPRFISSSEPGYSRHIVEHKEEMNLKPGSLCYARVNDAGEIDGLYPVMIARELAGNDASPDHLLPDGIRPAETIEELSPADQVFGWVSQKGSEARRNAWKGQLRIAHVTPGNREIETFSEPLPLAILSSPKPEQVRFYAAKDKSGLPHNQDPPGFDPIYGKDLGLRGRKFYPHQARLPDGYWDAPRVWEDRPKDFGGHRYREYLRPGRETDDQNRSVTGWVKPGTQFIATIDVFNLTREQLGGLLYILTLEGGHLKLGAGKPLGFGSVKTALKSVNIRSGQQIRRRFAEFDIAAAKTEDFDVQSAVDAFKATIENGYGKPFDQVSFIAAFQAVMRGFNDDLPVHYPRASAFGGGDDKPPPGPTTETRSYEWFVANKRPHDRFPGPRVWLDAIGQDGPQGLPWLAATQKPPSGGKRGGQGQRGSNHNRRSRR